MPSTLFHVAIGLVIGMALLQRGWDVWAVLAVATFTMLPDVDTFIGLWIPGAHRSALHNLFVPLLLGGAYLVDTRVRQRSFLDRHWGEHGRTIVKVSLLCLLIAGIGLDAFGSGTNLFYPVHDQYYDFSGKVEFSNQRGLVQTVFELEGADRGTSTDVHYATGFDPEQGQESEDVERVYNISANAVRFFLSIVIFFIAVWRLRGTDWNLEQPPEAA